MRAILAKAVGTPEDLVIQDLPDPVPGPGEVAVDIKAAALQFCLAHPRVAAIIPGGANLEQTLENKGLVDAAIPGGLWRGLKEAGCVRGDAPTPGNADGRL